MLKHVLPLDVSTVRNQMLRHIGRAARAPSMLCYLDAEQRPGVYPVVKTVGKRNGRADEDCSTEQRWGLGISDLMMKYY